MLEVSINSTSNNRSDAANGAITSVIDLRKFPLIPLPIIEAIKWDQTRFNLLKELVKFPLIPLPIIEAIHRKKHST